MYDKHLSMHLRYFLVAGHFARMVKGIYNYKVIIYKHFVWIFKKFQVYPLSFLFTRFAYVECVVCYVRLRRDE